MGPQAAKQRPRCLLHPLPYDDHAPPWHPRRLNRNKLAHARGIRVRRSPVRGHRARAPQRRRQLLKVGTGLPHPVRRAQRRRQRQLSKPVRQRRSFLRPHPCEHAKLPLNLPPLGRKSPVELNHLPQQRRQQRHRQGFATVQFPAPPTPAPPAGTPQSSPHPAPPVSPCHLHQPPPRREPRVEPQPRSQRWHQIQRVNRPVDHHALPHPRPHHQHPRRARKCIPRPVVLKAVAAGVLVRVPAQSPAERTSSSAPGTRAPR